MRKFAVVCFYTASKGGNGAAEVSLGIFNAIKSSKIRLCQRKTMEKH